MPYTMPLVTTRSRAVPQWAEPPAPAPAPLTPPVPMRPTARDPVIDAFINQFPDPVERAFLEEQYADEIAIGGHTGSAITRLRAAARELRGNVTAVGPLAKSPSELVGTYGPAFAIGGALGGPVGAVGAVGSVLLSEGVASADPQQYGVPRPVAKAAEYAPYFFAPQGEVGVFGKTALGGLAAARGSLFTPTMRGAATIAATGLEELGAGEIPALLLGGFAGGVGVSTAKGTFRSIRQALSGQKQRDKALQKLREELEGLHGPVQSLYAAAPTPAKKRWLDEYRRWKFFGEFKDTGIPTIIKNIDAIGKAETGKSLHLTGFRQEGGARLWREGGVFYDTLPLEAAGYGIERNLPIGDALAGGFLQTLHVDDLELQNPLVVFGGHLEAVREFSDLGSSYVRQMNAAEYTIEGLLHLPSKNVESGYVILDRLFVRAAKELGYDSLILYKASRVGPPGSKLENFVFPRRIIYSAEVLVIRPGGQPGPVGPLPGGPRAGFVEELPEDVARAAGITGRADDPFEFRQLAIGESVEVPVSISSYELPLRITRVKADIDNPSLFKVEEVVDDGSLYNLGGGTVEEIEKRFFSGEALTAHRTMQRALSDEELGGVLLDSAEIKSQLEAIGLDEDGRVGRLTVLHTRQGEYKFVDDVTGRFFVGDNIDEATEYIFNRGLASNFTDINARIEANLDNLTKASDEALKAEHTASGQRLMRAIDDADAARRGEPSIDSVRKAEENNEIMFREINDLSVGEVRLIGGYGVRAIDAHTYRVRFESGDVDYSSPGKVLEAIKDIPARITMLDANQILRDATNHYRAISAEMDRRFHTDILGRISDQLKHILPDVDPNGPIASLVGKYPTVSEVEARSAPVTPQVRVRLTRQMDKSLYVPDDFIASTNRIIRDLPDMFTRAQDLLSGSLRHLGQFMEPAQAARASARRGDPIMLAAARHDVYVAVEKAKSRASIMEWRGRNRKLFGLTHDDFARGVEPKSEAKIPARALQRLDDIVENPDDYVLTSAQRNALEELLHTETAVLQRQLEVGVDVGEIASDYWARVAIKSPEGAKIQHGTGVLGATPGHAKPRRFDTIREGIQAGYDYAPSLKALQMRLDTGIESISQKEVLKQVMGLSIAPKDRVPEHISAAHKAASENSKAATAAGDDDLVAVATEELRRAKAALRTAVRDASNPYTDELKYRGRIIPREVTNELQKYFNLLPRTISDDVGEFFQLYRSSMITGDFSQFFVQGTNLVWRNPVAWLKAVGYAVASVIEDPLGYVVRNPVDIEEAISYSAALPPTEFLLKYGSRTGFFGRAQDLFLSIPGIRQTQNAFEWFAFIGQVEQWKAVKGAELRRAGRELSQEELRGIGSVVRKELGIVLQPGLTRTQRKWYSALLFAPQFKSSFIGLMKDAATDSVEGREARRLISMLFGGSAALLIGASLALNDEMPNLTNPLEKGFWGLKVGDGYIYPLGPWQSWFRTIMSMGTHAYLGDAKGIIDDASFFVRGSAGLQIGTIADFLIGKDIVGRPAEFTPAGIANYLLREVGPIGPREAGAGGVEQFKRFPAQLGEVVGLKTSPLTPSQRRVDLITTEVIPFLVQSGQLPKGATIDADGAVPLFSGEYDLVNRTIAGEHPELQGAWEARRRERKDIFQQINDRRAVIEAAYVASYDVLYDEVLRGTRPSREVLDNLQTTRFQLRGELAQLYADKEYRKKIEGLDKSDARRLEDTWFNIYADVAGNRKFLTDEDWQKIDEQQSLFIEEVRRRDGELAGRFERSLELRDSVVEAHPIIKLKHYVDEVSRSYYDLAGFPVAQAEWLERHPEENVARWMIYGTKMHSFAAIDMALAKQAPGLAGEVLQSGAVSKGVYLSGLKHRLDTDEKMWQLSKPIISYYLSLPTDTGERTKVVEQYPHVNAYLVYWGYSDRLHTKEAASKLNQYMEHLNWKYWPTLREVVTYYLGLPERNQRGLDKKEVLTAHPYIDAYRAMFEEFMYETEPVFATEAAKRKYEAVTGRKLK